MKKIEIWLCDCWDRHEGEPVGCARKIADVREGERVQAAMLAEVGRLERDGWMGDLVALDEQGKPVCHPLRLPQVDDSDVSIGA